MKNIIVFCLSLFIIFIDKSDLISKDELIGKWIEVGRVCDFKGVCKETPLIPQQFNFKSNGIVYVDDEKMYYSIDKNSVLKISEKKNSNEFLMESAFCFLSENVLLIEAYLSIDNEKIYYKYQKL